jgi:hypothetical protein
MSISERYQEFMRQAGALAASMNLEVEYTTALRGSLYNTYDAPVVQVYATDTHEFMELDGGTTFSFQA